MREYRDAIVDLMKKAPVPYDLTSDELFDVADMLINTYESLYKYLPKEERNAAYALVLDKLNKLDGRFFRDINPDSFDRSPFRNELDRRATPLRDGRSVHLELGSFTRWPDDRTHQYVASEGIGDVIRLDMNPEFDLDVAASVTAMPFADESIDRIHSNSLFEHVPYPHETIREAFRVLRPGGYMLTVVPFHFVEHGCPGDFLRFTGSFFKEVGADAGFVDIITDTRSTSGIYYTSHQLLKAGLAMERDANHLCASSQVLHVYSLMLLAAAQAVDTLFHAHGASLWHTTFALMSKPGTYASRSRAPDRSKPFLDRFEDLICPKSGLPLKVEGNELVSLDGAHRYPVTNGKPNLFVMHGFNSGFVRKESSVERLAEFNGRPRLCA